MRTHLLMATTIAGLTIPHFPAVPEEGVLTPPAVIVFDWEMEKRFGLDKNDNDRMDLPNTYEYVHNLSAPCGSSCPSGPPTFKVTVRLAGSTVPTPDGPRPATQFGLAVLAPEEISHSGGTIETPATASTFTLRLPEGRALIETRVTRMHAGQLRSLRDTFSIQVEDFLVVSIGDSYASGEGSPERGIGTEANYLALMAHVTQLILAGKKDEAAEYLADQLVDRPYIWADDGVSDFDGTNGDLSPVIIDHQRAHRSTLSGPAQMAWKLEKADKRTSVTFVSLAASGATIRTGILGSYAGVNTEPWSHLLPALEPQIDALSELLACSGNGSTRSCRRQIDALLISVGGNDIAFSRAVAELIDADPTWDGILDPGHSYRYIVDQIFERVENKLANLPGRYEELAKAIAEKIPGVYNTYITTYPDPTLTRHYLTGPNGELKTCSSMLSGIAVNLEINRDEAREARERIVKPLNDALIGAARKHGWIVGDAREPFKGHGICSAGGPNYNPGNYPGNPFPSAVAPWPTVFFMRWFRTPTDARGVQGTPMELSGIGGAADGLALIDGEKALTKGTLHLNEYGYQQMARTLFEVLQLPVYVPGTLRDANDQIAEAVKLDLPQAGDVEDRSGTLSAPTDVDVFRLTVDKNLHDTVRITVKPRTDGEKARLRHGFVRLFDENGSEIGGGLGAAELQRPKKGTYYVGVSARENVQYDIVTGDGDKGGPQRGTYWVSVERTEKQSTANNAGSGS